MGAGLPIIAFSYTPDNGLCCIAPSNPDCGAPPPLLGLGLGLANPTPLTRPPPPPPPPSPTLALALVLALGLTLTLTLNPDPDPEQDLDGDMKYSCRDKKAEAASAPKECTMCRFLGQP